MLPSPKLEFVSSDIAPIPPQPPHPRLKPSALNDWTPRATRDDVVYLLVCFRSKEFSPRSMAGRIAIHESNAPKAKALDDSDIYAHINDLSPAQFRDSINTLVLRRAIYAKPEAPRYTDRNGEPLRRVAPLRDVAATVQPRPTRTSTSGSSARDWRATVNNLLGRIPRHEAEVLLQVTDLRQALKETKNKLEQEKRAARRLKAGGRDARNLRRHADERVSELQSKAKFLGDALKELCPTSEYRNGLDHLLAVCTATQEIEETVFTFLFRD